MKPYAIILFIVLTASIAWVVIGRKTVLQIGNQDLRVTIADSPEKIVQGLSGKKSLGKNSGMLFVLPHAMVPGFWMKDMHFALDIIWIDEEKKIVGIEKNISPATYPATVSPPAPVRYVLEVNAGWSDAYGISAGTVVSW